MTVGGGTGAVASSRRSPGSYGRREGREGVLPVKLGKVDWIGITFYHEAGHVVAAELLGWEVTEAKVTPAGREGWAGWVNVNRPDETSVLDECLMCLAGIAAEVLFGPFAEASTTWDDIVEGRFLSPGAMDLQDVQSLAEPSDMPAIWNYVLDQLRDHGQRVTALAEELRQAAGADPTR